MLTRSASKKQAGSPVKSVKKADGTNSSCNLLQSRKVNTQYSFGDGKEYGAGLQNVELKLEIVPSEADGENNSCNFAQTVTLNLSYTSSGRKKNFCKTNVTCKGLSPCITVNTSVQLPMKASPNFKNLTEKKFIDGSPARCCPKLTSSVRGSRRIMEKNGESARAYSTTLNEKILCEGKQESKLYNKLETVETFFEGVFVNGGYKKEDFKKKLAVQLVPVTDEQIRTWTTPKKLISTNLSSPTLFSSDIHNYSSDTSSGKEVWHKRLMEKLKLTDLYTSKLQEGKLSRAENVEMHRLRKRLELLFGESKESCNSISDQRELSTGQDFFEETSPLENISGLLNGCRDKNSQRCHGSQDSIATDIFDVGEENSENQAEESQTTLLPMDEMHNAIEKIIERLGSPDNPCGRAVEGDEKGPKRREKGGRGRLKGSKKKPDFYEVYSYAGDSSEETDTMLDESPTRGEEFDFGKSKEERNERKFSRSSLIGDDVFCGSGKGKPKDESVVRTLREGEDLYADGRDTALSELHRIQLECIQKEVQRRLNDSASSEGGKKLKSSGKAETDKKTSEDITEFGSARKTRRSGRFELMEVSPSNKVRTPTRRTESGKQSAEKTDNEFGNDVMTTPRSTRVKQLRKEALETIKERKRRTTDMSATPKRSKLSKVSQSEEEHDGKDEELLRTSSKRLLTPKKRAVEADSNESVNEEVSSVSSTPKKSKSPRKTSQMEVWDEKSNASGDAETDPETPEMISHAKSKSTMNSLTAEKSTFAEKTVGSLSSPVKKTEAAARLRAEEERLRQGQTKERVLVVASWPKKGNSPMKPSRTTDEESKNAEISASVSSPKMKKARTPTKSPKESEGDTPGADAVTSSRNQKTKSPKSTEEFAGLGNESNDLDTSVASSTKRQKSPKKQHAEQGESEENELNRVELPVISSPKLRKTESPKKKQTGKNELEERELEDTMCNVSVEKQRKIRSVRKEDVEEFNVSSDSDSACVKNSATSPNLKQKDESPKKLAELMEPEIDNILLPSTPKRQKSKSPQIKHVEEEESEPEVEDIFLPSSHKEKKSPSLQKKRAEGLVRFTETFENVATSVGSSSKKKRKKVDAQKVETTEAVADEQMNEISIPQSKISKGSKKGEGHENANTIISKLEDDFLAAISSKKIEVKSRSDSGREEKKERKKLKKKEKWEKIVRGDGGGGGGGADDYIPLNVGGATNFSVVGLNKFKSSSIRHPAFDLKRDLIYGSRVKRIPYSELQAYNLKLESRKMR